MFNLSETAKISYHYHSQKLKPSLGKRYLKYKFWTYFVFEIFKKSTLYYFVFKTQNFEIFCILYFKKVFCIWNINFESILYFVFQIFLMIYFAFIYSIITSTISMKQYFFDDEEGLKKNLYRTDLCDISSWEFSVTYTIF